MRRIHTAVAAWSALLLVSTWQAAFAHEHKAPHGGTLVVFGNEFAHLELVLDAKAGKLTAYVLDGEAEKAVRIQQKEFELETKVLKKKSSAGGDGSEVSLAIVRVKLKAVSSALTGEKEGDSSQFEGQDAALKDAPDFDAVLKAITIKGKEFKDVKFNFPKGNEDCAAHGEKKVEKEK